MTMMKIHPVKVVTRHPTREEAAEILRDQPEADVWSGYFNRVTAIETHPPIFLNPAMVEAVTGVTGKDLAGGRPFLPGVGPEDPEAVVFARIHHGSHRTDSYTVRGTPEEWAAAIDRALNPGDGAR